jgi:hypothetical protein
MAERVLVCGGRDFNDASLVERTLNDMEPPVRVVIQGGARGADYLGRTWAALRRLSVETYPAMWGRDGKAAGPIRNQAMLVNGRPDLVVAFPGGRGTADMVRRAKAAGIPILEITASAHLSPSVQEPTA